MASNQIKRVLGYAVFVEGRETEYFSTESAAQDAAKHAAQVLGWNAHQDAELDWHVTIDAPQNH